MTSSQEAHIRGIHPDDQPIADLVQELQRGDIPANFEHTGGGIMCCTIYIRTEGGEVWEWFVGLANAPQWGFDVTDGSDSILDPPWVCRAVGDDRGRYPAPSIADTPIREVARWLMQAITDMHGPTPQFERTP